MVAGFAIASIAYRRSLRNNVIMRVLSGLFIALGLFLGAIAEGEAQTASVLPNAESQFIDGNGSPYASGKVYFYIPGTTTPKTTWLDPNQTTANTNPVVLDAAGRALIYGSGQYRQVLFDINGNEVWDQLTWAINPASIANFAPGTLAGNPTVATGPLQSITVGTGLSLSLGGTLSTSAVYPTTVADSTSQSVVAGFNNTQRLASGSLTYTQPAGATLSNGFTYWVYALTNNVVISPFASDTLGNLSAGQTLTIPTGASARITGSGGSAWEYQLVFQNNNIAQPCGRLTLTSGTPVLTTTVSAATSVLYTPYNGCTTVPVWTGTQFLTLPFTETTQLLSDTTQSPLAAAANSVYDYFEWLNSSGSIVVTRGPAWSTATSRGYTLTRVSGLLMNTSAITNGPGSLAGVWVGTVATDSSGATVSFIPNPAAASGGPASPGAWIGLWNAYNRVNLTAVAQDSKASWSYSTATWRAQDASNTNRITYVVGNTDEPISVFASEYVAGGTGSQIIAEGIGIDSTSSPSGVVASTASSAPQSYLPASYAGTPGLGQHYAQALEYVNASATYQGLQTQGQLQQLMAQLRF